MYLSTIFIFQILNIAYNVVPMGDNERRTITLLYVVPSNTWYILWPGSTVAIGLLSTFDFSVTEKV